MLLILFVLVLLQIRQDYYHPLVDLVLLATAILAFISLVVTVIASRKVKIDLEEAGGQYVEGEPLNINFSVDTVKFCPNIKVKISRRILQTGEKKKIRLSSKDHNEKNQMLIEDLSPGTYAIDIDHAIFVGFFRLLVIFKRIKNSTSFTVYPKSEEFDYKKLPVFKQNGDGITMMQKGDDYSEIYEVRDFMDGDDIKYLHHALSAKYGKNMVKVGSKSERQIYIYYLEDGQSFEQMVGHLRKIIYLCQNKKIKENNSFTFVRYRNNWKILISNSQLFKFIDQVYKDYER